MAETFAAARNACKLCAPLGACLAFRGVEGSITLLHGSQGCATYIRRYMISHTREPLDIASSSFGEAAAIFGGRKNLFLALENVIRQYGPRLIGVATTCLAETIGDDVAAYLREFAQEHAAWPLPALVSVPTPSYAGTHADGYFRAVRALADQLAQGGAREERVNLIAGMVSPADLRHLRELVEDFGLAATLLPDYADPLDGPAWEEYQLIAPGGTPLAELRSLGRARASVELGGTFFAEPSAGALLAERFGVEHHALALPIGLRQSDAFFKTLAGLAGRPVPARHSAERGRLIDAYVDGHKVFFGKRALVYGEEDLVAGLANLLAEIGVTPVLCASGGGGGGRLRQAILAANPELEGRIEVREEMDFAQVEEAAAGLAPDLLIGSSKGYPLARKLGVPLVRVGFPIHDRIGGTRLLHLGYRGAQQLFDRIANALIEARQAASPVGYFYM